MLTIMGSGETAPTMVQTHRAVFAALPSPAEPAILLDTPFGFQENAAEIVERAQRYFDVSVGRHIVPVSFRSLDDSGLTGVAEFEAAVAAARFVFAGPGSPTYAMAQWQGTRLARLLADKVRSGGAVTFASAAAVSLGRYALPVYEIYKVGSAPHWVDGLDVLGLLGIDAAVIPHYDNAEGGTHDTRYCYMGERRLRLLESMLAVGTPIIGVDEHTACVIDWSAETVRVTGRGVLTVRNGGRELTVAAGETVGIEVLRGESVLPAGSSVVGLRTETSSATLAETVDVAEAEFARAITSGDAVAGTRAILELEQAITDWAADTEQSDGIDKARAALRALVVRLGDSADEGLADPRKRVAGFVAALLDLRDAARARGEWEQADMIRDRLVALGVEVRDTPTGSEWSLTADG